jgi:DNA-binding transcriptional ArsR family regulator
MRLQAVFTAADFRDRHAHGFDRFDIHGLRQWPLKAQEGSERVRIMAMSRKRLGVQPKRWVTASSVALDWVGTSASVGTRMRGIKISISRQCFAFRIPIWHLRVLKQFAYYRSMSAGVDLAKVAALMADPSRATMLCSLAGDESRSASELAILANVSPQTASRHLSLLVDSGLLTVNVAGRNKFYRLRGPRIVAAIESLLGISGSSSAEDRMRLMSAPELVFARTCYDHLAGVLSVAICERLTSKKFVRKSGAELCLTDAGTAFFCELGIDATTLRTSRQRFAYSCIDWIERRPHIGGALGAALFDWLLASKGIARRKDSRAIRVTDRGRQLLEETLSIRFSQSGGLAA